MTRERNLPVGENIFTLSSKVEATTMFPFCSRHIPIGLSRDSGLAPSSMLRTLRPVNFAPDKMWDRLRGPGGRVLVVGGLERSIEATGDSAREDSKVAVGPETAFR